jgi:hypothetical protein
VLQENLLPPSPEEKVLKLYMQAISMAHERGEMLTTQQQAFLKFNPFLDILASTHHCCHYCPFNI